MAISVNLVRNAPSGAVHPTAQPAMIMIDSSLRALDSLDEAAHSDNIDGPFVINELIHDYSHEADGLL